MAKNKERAALEIDIEGRWSVIGINICQDCT